MPIRVPLSTKRKVTFKQSRMASAPQAPPSQTTTTTRTTAPSQRLEEILSADSRIEELSDSEEGSYEEVTMAEPVISQPPSSSRNDQFTCLPPLFESPIPEDSYETETSQVQAETLEAILPFLTGNPNKFELNSYGIPKLQREKHVRFLEDALGDYPPHFAAMDASRPWMLYWSLQGLTVLGEDVSEYRER